MTTETTKTDTAKSRAAKPALAARDFKDEGTGRSFTKGEPVAAEPGEIANYRFAGLIAPEGDEKAA